MAEKQHISTSTPLAVSARTQKLFRDSIELKEVPTKKKSVLELVLEAIEAVGVKRKGASYAAIKKYIEDVKENNSSGEKKSSLVYLKKAITKGIEKGFIEKTKASLGTRGVYGFYVLTKSLKASKTRKIPEKSRKQPKSPKLRRKLSDGHVIPMVPKLEGKPRKLNLSDSALLDPDLIMVPKFRNLNNSYTIIKKKTKPLLGKNEFKPEDKMKPEKKDASTKRKVKTEPKQKKVQEKPDIEREDVTDSETVVAKPHRKPLKLDYFNTEATGNVHEDATKVFTGKEAESEDKMKSEKKDAFSKRKVKADPKKKIAKPKKIDIERKDLSDSEMVVRKPNRKSLKSYSSDTEVNDCTNQGTTKINRKKEQKVALKRNETAIPDVPPTTQVLSKTTKSRKLYNKAEDGVGAAKDVTEPKAKRTRAKRQM